MNSYSFDIMATPVGNLTIVFSDKGICSIEIGRQNRTIPEIPGHPPGAINRRSMSPAWTRQFEDYFQGNSTPFDILLDIRQGTIFRKKVWETLQTIPYGQTRPYRWVAEQINNAHAARAVGQANAANPVPILIPCHRVINSGGSLGGFSCGTDIKERLLRLEGVFLFKGALKN